MLCGGRWELMVWWKVGIIVGGGRCNCWYVGWELLWVVEGVDVVVGVSGGRR